MQEICLKTLHAYKFWIQNDKVPTGQRSFGCSSNERDLPARSRTLESGPSTDGGMEAFFDGSPHRGPCSDDSPGGGR